MQRSQGAILIEKVPRVADIVSFRFTRPPAYRFQAGQWFVITFPGPDPDKPYEHHFSHSDAPSAPWLELTTRLRGSEFKNALAALPGGAEVQIEGPYGSFTLPAEVKRAVFLAGGIGITCVRSILLWAAHAHRLLPGSEGPDGARPLLPAEFTLFFANRSEDGIPFKDELEQLTGLVPGLRVIHVLSQPGEEWGGYRGHLDENILEKEVEEPVSCDFFVSGPPSFDAGMHDVLTRWGIEDGRIRTERFEGY